MQSNFLLKSQGERFFTLDPFYALPTPSLGLMRLETRVKTARYFQQRNLLVKARSHLHNGPNGQAISLVHQVERLVNLVQLTQIRYHGVDVDFTLHV